MTLPSQSAGHTPVKVIDLFCGAGGAAMGLHRAWPDAEITGVDIIPQPRYPFAFVHADAMMYPLDDCDFIWASPPCQKYSKTAAFAKSKKKNPDLIARTRDRLIASGKPFVIENVPGAPLLNAATLCGTMFGLRVIRHRKFESSFQVLTPKCSKHGSTNSHRGYGTHASYSPSLFAVHRGAIRMRYPAAFINVIAEGKRFSEALEALQQTWDALVDEQAENSKLKGQLEEAVRALAALHDMYASTWDRVDGGLVMMGNGVERFEQAHELARDALSKLKEAGS